MSLGKKAEKQQNYTSTSPGSTIGNVTGISKALALAV